MLKIKIKIIILILLFFQLIEPTIAQNRFNAMETKYDFTKKIDSEGISCTIQIAAVNDDVTNGFGLEFGYLLNKKNKEIKSIQYYNWYDNYLANGKLIKSTNKKIQSAFIYNQNYNSREKSEQPLNMDNGEYWEFSKNTNNAIDILRVITIGPYAMSYFERFTNSYATIFINKKITPKDISDFKQCFIEIINY